MSRQGIEFYEQGKLEAAVECAKQVLAVQQKLYPARRYPAGHPDLARSLNNFGGLLQERGEYGRALPYLEQALAMRQKLYPATKYPAGHHNLAVSLHNLAALLMARGESAQALPYCEQALAMFQKLYPVSKYPDGHSELATSLQNLGRLLRARGEYERALAYYEEALAMRQKLYPATKYPDGHPQLANSLVNLGSLLLEREDSARAQPYCEQALAMLQKLYPAGKYPDGHPGLATSLNNLGLLLRTQGEYWQAQPYCEQALAMWQKLYPASRYPDGHPSLASGLISLGLLLEARGESARALPYIEQALAMQQSLTDRLLESSALAEAALYSVRLRLFRDSLLSVTAHTGGGDSALYARVWAHRSLLSRLMERRHQSLQAVAATPEIRRRCDELTDVSRQLTRLYFNPPLGTKKPDEKARALTARKERLERDLAPLVPILAAQKELDQLGPADLQDRLPERAAFVDLLRYALFAFDPQMSGKKGEKRLLCYVAFVLTRDRIARVELGDAKAIEEALRRWRQAIHQGHDDPAAGELRRRVWEPIARHLPAGTDTVYLAPDGALTRLPWNALPGDQAGTVLLEHYTLAVVPHGRYLLARLRNRPDHVDTAGLLLAVGGVQYDARPTPVSPAPPTGDLIAALPADRAGALGQWAFLPATEQELRRFTDLPSLTVHAVSGAEASTARLFRELPQARIAHLATHGFFAQEAFVEELRRAARQLEHWQFEAGRTTEPVGLGVRNPLSFAGLVLAGANRPQEAGPDGGILTGEALIQLPLERMELAVLSACQTGLGSVADGECAHSLQLAFHIAGCKNVVASLWNVPDQATAALMAVFYDELLTKHRPPLEALRQAQLTLYHHPQQIAELAERGPIRRKLAQPGAMTELQQSTSRAAVKDWAGFVLSGLGK
jgi:CHAT domain-containing protein/Tfp pilus assembly protein PilF